MIIQIVWDAFVGQWMHPKWYDCLLGIITCIWVFPLDIILLPIWIILLIIILRNKKRRKEKNMRK